MDGQGRYIVEKVIAKEMRRKMEGRKIKLQYLVKRLDYEA
jgi:hypothetical protein